MKFYRNSPSGNHADINGKRDRMTVGQLGMMNGIGDFHNCAEALRKVNYFYA
jgi:hypothetical protein